MFKTQKVRRHDKFRKEWSQHYNKCKSQMGQDQVSGGVSVICLLATPVAMFYGYLQNLGHKVKIGNKVKFGNKVANWCNILSIEGVIVYGHVPECHISFWRGRLRRHGKALHQARRLENSAKRKMTSLWRHYYDAILLSLSPAHCRNWK